eukprot:12401152-Karenia_brevis.AAC.1
MSVTISVEGIPSPKSCKQLTAQPTQGTKAQSSKANSDAATKMCCGRKCTFTTSKGVACGTQWCRRPNNSGGQGVR